MQANDASLYWRYSAFYFLYFIFFAFQVAFLPVLCNSIGFDATQIAWVNTWTTLSTTIAPVVAQFVAHRILAPKLLFKISLLASSLVLILQMGHNGIVQFTLIWMVCVFLNRSALSLAEVTAIREDMNGRFSFERVRLWGSVGFIVGTYLSGSCLDYLGGSRLRLFAWLTSLLTLVGMQRISSKLKDAPGKLSHAQNILPSSDNTEVSYNTCFKLLLLITGIHYLSQSCYYVFFSLHLRHLGFSGKSISTIWSIGVISEVIFLAYFPKIEKRISKISLLRLSILFNSVRMVILGLSHNVVILCLSQILHIFSFATFYVALIRLTQSVLPDSLKDRGQGFLTFSAGVGGLIGRILLTQGVENTSIENLFLVSAVISIMAYPITFAIKGKQTSS